MRVDIDQEALYVVNHSGGKDSQAMMIKFLEHVDPKNMLVIHATLGRFEWPEAMEHAKQQADAAGVPFIVVQAKRDFLGMVYGRFESRPDVPSFPSPKYRQCTSDLKRSPIQKAIRAYTKQHGIKKVVNCVGLRKEESSERAKRQCFVPNKELSKAGRTVHDFLPIHDMTTDEVFQTIEKAGQQPHVAYKRGNKRLSCIFCIMACDGDLKNGAKHNPEIYAEYVAAERHTGYAMFHSGTLEDKIGIDPEISVVRWVN